MIDLYVTISTWLGQFALFFLLALVFSIVTGFVSAILRR